MIITKVTGGLGNQFFVYATAYALAKENNVEIIIDDMEYCCDSFRKYALDNYNTTYSKKLFNKKFYKIKNKYIRGQILCRIKKKLKLLSPKMIRIIEHNHEFVDFNIEKNKDYYLEGYWQCAKYFHKYKEDLKKEFTKKHIDDKLKEKANNIVNDNYCAIHVRHGDYAIYYGGSILDLSYYLDAIDIMNKTNKHIKFLVFSDDIQYCKKAFKDYSNMEYVSDCGYTDEEELYLMSKCKHFIIANSTFSWWGAYLGYKSDSKVICPFLGMWNDNFYLDEWIKLPAKLCEKSEGNE